MNGSFVRRNVSLDSETDRNVRALVDATNIPFSVMLRTLFGTPAAATDTFAMVRERYHARLEKVIHAHPMRKSD